MLADLFAEYWLLLIPIVFALIALISNGRTIFRRIWGWRNWLLGGLIVLPLLIFMLWKFPAWQIERYRTDVRFLPKPATETENRFQLEKDFMVAENSARQTLAQIIGGMVLLAGLYFTWLNIKVSEEGKLTDRFSKAIELLGNKELDIRLGGIYALERIARDSKKDHWTVMEVLTAYVREHASTRYEDENTKSDGLIEEVLILATPTKKHRRDVCPRADLQEALTVIGRRNVDYEGEHQRLNLSRVILKGASLSNGNFNRAFVSYTVLDSTLLTNAKFNGAAVVHTSFVNANLERAELSQATIMNSNFEGASLDGTVFDGAELYNSDLSKAEKLTWEQLKKIARIHETKLPAEIEEKHKQELNKMREITTAELNKNRENKENM